MFFHIQSLASDDFMYIINELQIKIKFPNNAKVDQIQLILNDKQYAISRLAIESKHLNTFQITDELNAEELYLKVITKAIENLIKLENLTPDIVVKHINNSIAAASSVINLINHHEIYNQNNFREQDFLNIQQKEQQNISHKDKLLILTLDFIDYDQDYSNNYYEMHEDNNRKKPAYKFNGEDNMGNVNRIINHIGISFEQRKLLKEIKIIDNNSSLDDLYLQCKAKIAKQLTQFLRSGQFFLSEQERNDYVAKKTWYFVNKTMYLARIFSYYIKIKQKEIITEQEQIELLIVYKLLQVQDHSIFENEQPQKDIDNIQNDKNRIIEMINFVQNHLPNPNPLFIKIKEQKEIKVENQAGILQNIKLNEQELILPNINEQKQDINVDDEQIILEKKRQQEIIDSIAKDDRFNTKNYQKDLFDILKNNPYQVIQKQKDKENVKEYNLDKELLLYSQKYNLDKTNYNVEDNDDITITKVLIWSLIILFSGWIIITYVEDDTPEDNENPPKIKNYRNKKLTK